MTNNAASSGDFDVVAFHAAVDDARAARGLTWAGVARELNAPIAHLANVRPYSASTLYGMTAKRPDLLNPHMVMNLLRWLGRTAESFMPGHPDAAVAARIPDSVPPGLGRWNLFALKAALEAECAERGMTQPEAAAEIGVAPETLRKVQAGRGNIGISSLVRITIWLGRPATDFFF